MSRTKRKNSELKKRNNPTPARSKKGLRIVAGVLMIFFVVSIYALLWRNNSQSSETEMSSVFELIQPIAILIAFAFLSGYIALRDGSSVDDVVDTALIMMVFIWTGVLPISMLLFQTSLDTRSAMIIFGFVITSMIFLSGMMYYVIHTSKKNNVTSNNLK